MNCNEARRMVTPFINKELTDKETELFLNHIEACSECKDELDVYFTVYRALDFLDSGTHHDFDFKKMLESEIQMERKGIKHRKVLRISKGLLLLVTELLLLFSVYTGYEMRQGEISRSMFQKAIHRLHFRQEKAMTDIEKIPENTHNKQKPVETEQQTEN